MFKYNGRKSIIFILKNTEFLLVREGLTGISGVISYDDIFKYLSECLKVLNIFLERKSTSYWT